MNTSYDSITNSIYLTKGATDESQPMKIRTGQASYTEKNIIVLHKNSNDTEDILCKGNLYNIDGYTYCSMSTVLSELELLGEYDENGVYQISKPSGKLVKLDKGMEYFYFTANSDKKILKEIYMADELLNEAMLTDKTFDPNITKQTADGYEFIIPDIGIKVISTSNYTFEICMGTGNDYIVLDGTEGRHDYEKGNPNADDKLILIDLQGDDPRSYFSFNQVDYKGSKVTSSRMEDAKSMSRAQYDNEYKVLNQWAIPFIYEDRDNKIIYEAIIVENLLETSSGRKCLKESFFKVEDFVNYGNKILDY
ncbi:hypothetical protein SDC9_102890 [bioreactor metagenome]|uniref:Uncharacterized protein n=1 Tax=bioreactor metagenome TaxID=1076179 RepID=A0A645AUX1_9ZZZZ